MESHQTIDVGTSGSAHPISPPVGEMRGRAEGGIPRHNETGYSGKHQLAPSLYVRFFFDSYGLSGDRKWMRIGTLGMSKSARNPLIR